MINFRMMMRRIDLKRLQFVTKHQFSEMGHQKKTQESLINDKTEIGLFLLHDEITIE